MKKISNGWLATIIIVIAIFLDQAVKIWVKTHFYYGEQVDVTSWFKILFIENNGMAYGMELGSKTILTWLRLIFSALFIYYLFKIRRRTDLPKGFVACIAFITAGAIGNVIDCVAYGQLFNDPIAPQVAQFMPSEGGYASLFNGKVVDMLYFPLAEWDWPQWMPWVGGKHYLFFQPIFNIADACLTTSILTLLIFYNKHLAGEKKEKKDDNEEKNNDSDQQPETNS